MSGKWLNRAILDMYLHWAKLLTTILGTAGGQGPLEAAIRDANATSLV
jgi:hypothetical protein